MINHKKNYCGVNAKNLNNVIDMESLHTLLAFHAKTNIWFDPLITLTHTTSADVLQKLRLSDTEISPFHANSIACTAKKLKHTRRQRSANSFSEEKVSFTTIQSLLINSFSVDTDGSRPYPSAGAIYPIEPICILFHDKCKDAPPAGVYHFRAFLQVLQPLLLCEQEVLQKQLYCSEMKTDHPAFCIVYVASSLRLLTKYGYRGYRHGLIEVGAMMQQADRVGQALGLKNRCFSGFSDHELTHFLKLDSTQFLPLLIQFFGV